MIGRRRRCILLCLAATLAAFTAGCAQRPPERAPTPAPLAATVAPTRVAAPATPAPTAVPTAAATRAAPASSQATFALRAFGTPSPSTTPEAPGTRQATATGDAGSSPDVGGEGRIKGGAPGIVAATPADLDAAIEAVLRRDEQGFLALAAAGTVFLVQDEPRVTVLERGGATYPALRVRVLEGSMAGRSGWVAAEQVTK